MKTIVLDTREKRNIYYNPTRQDIVRLLRLNGRSMTPKELADRLDISASSATFHIKKLMELGIVELERTQVIHGITARYYRLAEALVNLGNVRPGGDREASNLFLRQAADQVLEGVARLQEKILADGMCEEQAIGLGDALGGVAYLTREEAAQLHAAVLRFLNQREARRPGTQAYEYLLMAYNASEVRDDVE